MADKVYDVIIIGAGPAGLTAAIYASREKLSTLVLEKTICGGWLMYVDLIENYPGFPEGIKGPELAHKFLQQAQRFGAEVIESADVNKIERTGSHIIAKTSGADYKAKSFIVTSGTKAKRLNIPGEEEYIGKGISYCATCDGPLFKDKAVMVIGGGNAACEEALFLSRFAKKVILLNRKNELRAAKILQERLDNEKRIQVLLNHRLISISGAKTVNSAVVEDGLSKKQIIFDINGIFVFIGSLPAAEFLKGVVGLDEAGYIKTDENMQTSSPGIFAAGDICAKKVRQISNACAEGTTAAISVRDYLKNL